MPVPPNHGFPESQPSSGASSNGTGTVSNDLVRRELEYQEAIAKRNKLLLDPNPVRAMQAIRDATRQLAEEERKYGQAVKERMALMSRGGTVGGGVVRGNGVTSPAFAHGGPLQTVQPQVPQNAGQATGTGGSSPSIQGSPARPAFGSAVSGAFSTVAKTFQAVNAPIREFSTPFTDSDTKFFRTVGKAPVIGEAVGAAREFQQFLQLQGTGRDADEQKRLLMRSQGEAEHVTIPQAAFAQRFSPDRDAAQRRLASLGRDEEGRPQLGNVPVIPPEMYRRAGVTDEYRFKEQSALLPARREVASTYREEEAAKGALETLVKFSSGLRDAAVAADKAAGAFRAQAEKTENSAEKSVLLAKAANKSNEATGYHKLMIENEDEVKRASLEVIRATAQRQAAQRQQQGTELGFLHEREAVAASQAQRMIGMGPADRMYGTQMLKMVQEMEKSGADLSMLPVEAWHGAASVGPDTVRKIQEKAGGSLIDQAKAAGMLPQEEFRDSLQGIRTQADALSQKMQGAEGSDIRESAAGTLKAFTDMVDRYQRLREAFEYLNKQIEMQSLYLNSGALVK